MSDLLETLMWVLILALLFAWAMGDWASIGNAWAFLLAIIGDIGDAWRG